MSQDITVDVNRPDRLGRRLLLAPLPRTRRGRIILALSLIAAAVITGTGIALWYLRADTLAHSQQELLKLGRVLSEQTAQSMQYIDAIARTEQERMSTRTSPPETQQQMHDHLSRVVEEASQVAGVFITNSEGHIIRSSYAHPPPDISVAHRSYFAEHHNHRVTGSYIGEVQENRTLREPTFWLSRAWRDATGEFRGAVVVAIRAHYFEELYRSLDLDYDAAIALYRTDGTLLIDHNSPPKWARNVSRLIQAGASGSVDAASANGSTGNHRLSVVQPVRGFPLVIAVSRAKQGSLAPWSKAAWAVGGSTVFAMGLLALLMAMLARQSARQEADEHRLRHSESLLQEAQHIAHVGSWTYVLGTRELRWSQEACRIFMLDPQIEPTRRALLKNVHRDDRWLLLHAISTCMKGGRSDIEIRVSRGLRQPRWIQLRMEQSGDRSDGSAILRGTVLDITERKEAEASRAQLAAIVESTDEAIVSVSMDGTVLSWNRGAERIYGYASAEVLEKNIREVFSPRDDVDTRALLDIVRSGQSVEHYETTRSARGGEMIDVALTVSPIMDVRDRMVAASFISRDISSQKKETARRNVEHAVTRALLQASSSQQALRDVIQALCLSLGWDHGARWYLDAEENRLCTAEHWTHPSLEASAFVASAVPVKRLVAKLERGLVNAVFDSGQALWSADVCRDARFLRAEAARAAGLRTAFMFPIRSNSGTIGVLEFFSCERREPDHALFETAEAVSGQIGQYIERQRAEEERLAADARLQRIMANIPDVVFQLNRSANGSFSLPFISERVSDLYGSRAADVMKDREHWLTPVAAEHRRPLLKSLLRSMRAWEPWSFEALITCANGLNKWIRGQASVRRTSDGSVYWDGVLSDITLQKRAAIEILTMNEKLEKRVAERTHRLEAMNRELEAFSYSVSHDLRAPLRSVEGFCSLLLQKYGAGLDAAALSYVNRVQGAGRRMSELVDDLLKLARISRTELQMEQVDLSTMARAAAKALQEASSGRSVQVDIEDGVFVYGDARLLHVVLDNLLGNAWKFTHRTSHPVVAFGKTWHNGRSAIFVRDNGAGFDMKYVHKLFAPFQRLHRSGDFEGTGIGLATVQRIIALHGGQVWAEAEVNRGATFFFAL